MMGRARRNSYGWPVPESSKTDGPRWRYDRKPNEEFLGTCQNPYDEELDLYWIQGTNQVFWVRQRRGSTPSNYDGIRNDTQEYPEVWRTGIFACLWEFMVKKVNAAMDRYYHDPSVSPTSERRMPR